MPINNPFVLINFLCKFKQGHRGLQGSTGLVPMKDIEELKQLVGNLTESVLVSQSVVWL